MKQGHVQFSAGLMFSFQGSKAFLLELFQEMGLHAPSYVPVLYGRVEPLRNKFVYENADSVIAEEDKDLFWTTREQLSGHWTTGLHLPRKRHNLVSFCGEKGAVDVTPLLTLFRALCGRYAVDYGWIHATGGEEFDQYKKYSYEAIQPFNTAPTTHDLRKWLPNLAWANIFGRPYIDLFSREKLLSCPTFLSEAWTEEAIFLQLSDDIKALSTQFQQFENIRGQAIGALGGGKFFYTPGALPGEKVTPSFF